VNNRRAARFYAAAASGRSATGRTSVRIVRELSGTFSKIESLARGLPDPEAACLFYERVTDGRGRGTGALARDEGLLSDALALAAWSPLLATTLEQHTDFLAWLARERLAPARVRAAEELQESLARFALTHTQTGSRPMLALFRRRELLRIYLRDIRRDATLVETTEEISNLADAVLRHALADARQELENLYGAPQCTDARGRKTSASLSVVGLGKLGSRELNYASDIDLLFIYSDEGETSGAGERGAVTNREFFCKLAERVSRTAGGDATEGGAYRVDLRLRPHGRDGALAVSVEEALRYYREAAHPWELQALIRARAAAGSEALFTRFREGVRARVYRRDETVERALEHVRLAKQKIDRFRGEEQRGFNVKLGRGGIREIEFVAQALQLAHGGADSWLQEPHTLISLGRLAERGLVSKRERAELSDAYDFLRTVEHRVQMEHGLQTHTVPEDAARRALLARRMHFEGSGALAEFDRALALHTSNVSRAYARVFGRGDSPAADASKVDEGVAVKNKVDEGAAVKNGAKADEGVAVKNDSGVEANAGGVTAAPSQTGGGVGVGDEPETRALCARAELREARDERAVEHAWAVAAAEVFARYVRGRYLSAEDGREGRVERLARLLRLTSLGSLNRRRALSTAARVAASLEKSGESVTFELYLVRRFMRLCGASEFFGEMLTSSPALIEATGTRREKVVERDHRALLRAAVDSADSFGAELSALRRAWAHLLVEIGAREAEHELTPSESNALQTSLAAAGINVALLVARRELARRHGRLAAGPRLAVLGLGRLGSGGMDYGSDLDLVMVYDEDVPSPVEGLTREQAYARMVELASAALSNLTRDGYLYRVDLRLRPDGRNGALASPSRAFVSYLRERADAWEWLAYVKLRAVAGDLEFGRRVEERARAAVHEAAGRARAETLREETRRVRERLERERAPRGPQRAVDIKYGPGGMLDVYFAARFLQLRDNLPDGEDRSTRATLAGLRAAGSISEGEFESLCEGYALLRRLDHQLRFIAGRSTRLPHAQDHPLLRDLARSAGYASAASLSEDLVARMSAVRAAYERVTRGPV
jgi:[glutamine synthetase] adenylyltransferase / [glutamine synthetase]-adenylyl-L-tyrosine phosphorylase